VGPGTGLDFVEKKFMPLLELEFRLLGHPARSLSLCRLRYVVFLRKRLLDMKKQISIKFSFPRVFVARRSEKLVICVAVWKQFCYINGN
jgi:hypothetical protein